MNASELEFVSHCLGTCISGVPEHSCLPTSLAATAAGSGKVANPSAQQAER
jgi:hypothetical protein